MIEIKSKNENGFPSTAQDMELLVNGQNVPFVSLNVDVQLRGVATVKATVHLESLRLLVQLGEIQFSGLEHHMVTREDIDEIEYRVGMGHRAWDMVNTRELVVACFNVLVEKLLLAQKK